MFETIKDIYDTIFKEKNFWKGVLKVTIIISFFFIVDGFLNFTYSIDSSRRINTLLNIYQLKEKINTTDFVLTNRINQIEKEIINSHHYSYYLTLGKIPEIIDSEILHIKKIINNSKLNFYFVFVISNIVFIIFLYVAMRQLVIGYKYWFNSYVLVKTSIAIIILLFIMYFTTRVAYSVPILYNIPFFNYVLYFIAHLLFIYPITKLINRKKTN